ncbi:MAG: hypothetical protein U0793_27605 [Gemmataceae bacterium]
MTGLVKKIDAKSSEFKAKGIKSFVVMLNDDEKIGDQLKAFAEKQGIKKLVLSIDNVAGPKDYKIAKDADVTVMLYTNRDVKANFAFRKGELTAAKIDEIVAALPKIAPKK